MLLLEAAQLAPCRYIVIGPTILEASADLRGGRAELKVTPRPAGPLVTLASPDKSFEVHLQAALASEATLGVSEKTGRGTLRFLGKDKRPMLTVVFMGDDADSHFDVLFGRWGSCVQLN
ncbi:unnamed protein product [Prorocentrum cordatum]|uniref:Uncharacterized protein n=1 Tax=Prorocentrum cordatum TaxID=2364126 RepID=A0ABN9PRH0_9DINO|nr:unnamed protein product [Polarella glacialis]